MQASDAHPKASDGHPKASDGRTKAANGQFICTAKKLSQCFIEKKYLLYEKRKSALQPSESHHEDDKKPPCSNKKQAARWTPPRSTFHFLLFTFRSRQGKLFPLHYSLFTSAGLTFHFHKRELPYITPIQCSTYGARMAVKMPLRVRPSDA